MEKGNTKQEILDAALELFSTQGYEATSVAPVSYTHLTLPTMCQV